jgi:L-cystine transport system permease protein
VKLLPYLRVTFIYAGISLVLGIVFGFFLAAAKVCKIKALNVVGYVYTAVFRSIPPIVLLFLVYHGIPKIAEYYWGTDLHNLGSLFFVTLTITLLSSNFISEIMRSAYTSVDKGQYEAAVSIGLSKQQALWRIVYPQAVYLALPSMGNIIIFLIKEGSLGYTIGLLDVFGKANNLNGYSYNNYVLEIYFSLAAIYWILSILIEKGMALAEKKTSAHLRGNQ